MAEVAEAAKKTTPTPTHTPATVRSDDVLTAEGLTKAYGTRTVVDDLDVRVGQAEILGFLGPNGAGKSTSISMLSGALRPDAGSIGVNGVDMLAKPRVAKRLIGVVPQDIALYPTLSAEQNLRFFTGVYRIPRKERAERVAWALDVVGLSDRAKDRVSTFSGGMKRRVNIAAGMLHRPRLLFLDEPTVGVDAQSRNAIFDTVLRLRAELDMSVVYTSHYMNEVERLCDRVVIIDHGRSIANGSQEELLAPLGAGVVEWRLTDADLALVDGGVDQLAGGFSTLVDEPETTTTAEGAVLRMRVSDPRPVLEHALEVSARLGPNLTGVRIARPDLETLFLDLTGRNLRDGD